MLIPSPIASPEPPDADRYQPQHRLLDRYVRGDQRSLAVQALRRYFREDGTPGDLFEGRRFERFDGGGDNESICDRITPADVLALTFLSVTRGLPRLAIALLEERSARVTELLRDIPTGVAMHETDWATCGPGAPASALWDILRTCAGKDRWVTANKLLARKRPHLIPVYDSEVRQLLGGPDGFWACLWSWFHSDPSRAIALAELRGEVAGLTDISLLRTLDVVLWMHATGKVRIRGDES
jgi:hypothetical protein